jgi:hypothetical protein
MKNIKMATLFRKAPLALALASAAFTGNRVQLR